MEMTTHIILDEAAAVVTVAPWARKPVNGDRFDHVHALAERLIR